MARISLLRAIIASSFVSTLASAASVAFAVVAVSGCSLGLSKDGAGQVSSNQCSDDSDCAGGVCWAGQGLCVAHQGSLSTLLLEVTPPSNVAGIGGVRFLELLNGFSRSGTDYKLDLHPAATVHGFVRANDPKESCASQESGGVSVPVQVTISPREQAYGLPVVSYVATTRLTSVAGTACASVLKGVQQVDEFEVALPAGKYDIYVSPTATSGGDAGVNTNSGCVPQLFSNQDASAACLALSQGSSESLSVAIQTPLGESDVSLDGYGVDVVHPVTGQVLSNHAVLQGSPSAISAIANASSAAAVGYVAHLSISTVVGGDPLTSAQELVRLTPPSTVVAPVIQLERSALEANSSPGVAVTPVIGPFPGPVDLGSWVWSADALQAKNQSVPVPSSVSLTATSLTGVPDGIFAAFSTTVKVGQSGVLSATVLPGEYRVRAVPNVGLGFAATQSSIAVACSHLASGPDGCASAIAGQSPPPETGKVLLMPQASTLTGSIYAPFGNKRVDGATVEVLPASIGSRQCDADGGATCGQVATVLDEALGQDAFVPRSASALATNGRFTLAEVDCGGCTPGTGALFDLSVRPPDGSGFPWFVDPGVTVSSDIDFKTLAIPLPIIQRGVVEVLQGTTAEPVSVPGALIRAYVLRDNLGAVVDSPGTLPSCTSAGVTGGARCIRSALQVAETRADGDGTFMLVVPASL